MWPAIYNNWLPICFNYICFWWIFLWVTEYKRAWILKIEKNDWLPITAEKMCSLIVLSNSLLHTVVRMYTRLLLLLQHLYSAQIQACSSRRHWSRSFQIFFKLLEELFYCCCCSESLSDVYSCTDSENNSVSASQSITFSHYRKHTLHRQ